MTGYHGSSAKRFRLPRRFKFTRVGKIFTGITLLVSIAAFNTGNNPLYLLFAMMLSLIVISGILSESVLQDVVIQRYYPSRIFAGQDVLVGLKLTNFKKRIPSFSLQVIERFVDLKGEDRPFAYFLRVDPETESSGYFRYTFPHRGVWRSDGFEVATSFPFEFFRKGRELDHPWEVIVFPTPAPPPPLRVLGISGLGSQPRPIKGADGDFFALREFRPLDDVRQIHWKLSAKRDHLMTRDLERQEAPKITLCFHNVWHPNPTETIAKAESDHRDLLEGGINLCAGIAKYLISLGHPISLIDLDGRLPFGSDERHLELLWTRLARLHFHGDPKTPEIPFLANQSLLVEPGEQCILMAHSTYFPPLPGAHILHRIPF